MSPIPATPVVGIRKADAAAVADPATPPAAPHQSALWRGGLRGDQAAAVYGILTSSRKIDILIGPLALVSPALWASYPTYGASTSAAV
ncbi:hypothetical protein [Thermostaphylospora chromogena]|uniref:hypothetical protein n=1 Tax=Thermostaphylospora chromogena TaxID=35622 RepID=UPI0010427033|nr:hypothetical protein [Thermostaphylospora chromogena]